MLPLIHQECYQTFKQDLDAMQQILAQPDDNRLALKTKAAALQRYFRELLLNLPLHDLAPALQDWVQSYHVEIDKQLKLLGVDVLFLQAARQSATTQQRQQQMHDRLDILQRYCEALLGSEE